MKIKAKKTNSTSENAIRYSYFVIELRKLIHLSLSTLSVSEWHLQHSYVIVPLYVGRFHSKNKNTDQSYQWPATFPAGLF